MYDLKTEENCTFEQRCVINCAEEIDKSKISMIPDAEEILRNCQRWIAAPGGRDGELDGKLAAPLVNRNSANAAAVSSAEAKKYLLRCTKIIKECHLPSELIDASLQYLESLKFAHLPSYSFLCTLNAEPGTIGSLDNLIISVSDPARYRVLTSPQHMQSLALAFKRLKGRQKDILE
ncbi:hypothetical protein ARMGADRAFT_1029972 [Armillaria gallica]|uniref:Uncharacterized protein n=1 Tax=Armillaria gallica TaxID=47427 RepID=A0A2H3E3A8_ARMGA|nr:hypothetical protein ARMGADRAFT_1029972 [Armillaria gallica]